MPPPAFSIDDEVRIIATGTPGRVIGKWQNEESDWKYLVRYREAPRMSKEVWFLGAEIEIRNPTP